MKAKPIKNIIWDVDGTLYQYIPELTKYNNLFRQNFLTKYLPDLAPVERENRLRELMGRYKGSTLALAKISGLSILEVGQLNEQAVPKSRYLKKEPKLRQLFQEIKKLKINNYVLRNGTTNETIKIIKLLGLLTDKDIENSNGFFSQIIGSFDFFGQSKPDLAVFKYFVKELGLNPAETLSVGDRPEIELIPAKKLGMQTALIWQNQVPQQYLGQIDYVLPMVYDLISIL